jgi:allantoinase
VVTARGEAVADIAVEAGRITEVGPDLRSTAAEEIDASGLHVFPGGIDTHVHFNDPGRTEWETIADGSAALAAGGYTSFVDMPLNNVPVTTDAAAFDIKLEVAKRSSRLDFWLWGGLIPGNLDQLEELVGRGVFGFKAFMCPTLVDEFPMCDEATLREGMKRIASLGSIVLVHCEDPAQLESDPTWTTAREFVRSRPPAAEVDAIALAIAIAADAGCRLHIVHVSTVGGAEMIHEARRHGVDVSAETCPQYLLYVADDLERLGGLGKCTPPVRTPADRDGLWKMLGAGRLEMVVSDHSPSTLELKQGPDFFQLWGGISGCQTTRQLLLAHADDLSMIAAVTATNITRRFGLAGKGDIAPGYDADLWIVDLKHETVVRREDLLYRNPYSAHEGQTIRGRTIKTLVRGKSNGGRFIRPGGRS